MSLNKKTHFSSVSRFKLLSFFAKFSHLFVPSFNHTLVSIRFIFTSEELTQRKAHALSAKVCVYYTVLDIKQEHAVISFAVQNQPHKYKMFLLKVFYNLIIIII